ncbi:MAG: hypothetical protein ACJ741_10375 [Pyrinomonadaceae bacterium]
MKGKIRTAFLMCALAVGLSAASASAQTVYRTPGGRTVVVQNRRVYRRPSRTVVVVPNRGRSNWWARRRNAQVSRARTYRLSNGRIVTVLPNGRRIYR